MPRRGAGYGSRGEDDDAHPAVAGTEERKHDCKHEHERWSDLLETADVLVASCGKATMESISGALRRAMNAIRMVCCSPMVNPIRNEVETDIRCQKLHACTMHLLANGVNGRVGWLGFEQTISNRTQAASP
mmetsp:Transcript_4165/g.11955  ORF Transcript_4165/g.11955 Transcript_4165/m.11955 type:complete len:131 (+) Transcript_4165:135-527(+)